MNKTITEIYNELSTDEEVGDRVNNLVSEIVTRIVSVPEIRQAVLLAALRVDAYIKEDNPDTIGDVPFYMVWNHIMSEKDTLD
ncbi:hypothetical protein LCGC14_1851510 [marine sediment metagenome]|uniref:Uncharacterized protein n=1 Tax=marine sediment metagenome TaxID=412755 RepID=A0A0F9IPW4_9ZZZZ